MFENSCLTVFPGSKIYEKLNTKVQIWLENNMPIPLPLTDSTKLFTQNLLHLLKCFVGKHSSKHSRLAATEGISSVCAKDP